MLFIAGDVVGRSPMVAQATLLSEGVPVEFESFRVNVMDITVYPDPEVPVSILM